MVSIGIVGSEDEEAFDKSIADIALSSVGDRHLQISVAFNKPTDITADIAEPDKLEIKFNIPELIIDAETSKNLQVGTIS